MNRNDMKPIIEILPEIAFFYLCLQVLVCGGDDSDIDLNRFLASHGIKFTLLQYAQKFSLKRSRHIPDFIQENRSFMSLAEQSFRASVGAGERTFFMTEELAFEQGCRQSRTVDGHKGFVSSTARQMDCFGNYFLARTALTLQKYSGFGAGDARDHIQDPSHSFAFRDDIRKIVSFL